ncbi:catalase family peroxidase [Granulicella tundricola]|uniref:Catalase-related peroxidase n=1 Tax=Granulicella tundricola (strain ATCC BAA-1859 / DSM 23138 / MP5ACTX9) TaxID=1198114 RepID=E8X2Z7_GRATM|nr:catalase family peroxidase [Granulicella tundricola]ADW68131.1 Catalase related subgroup [Granulicella tundricola MP5ACTX9]
MPLPSDEKLVELGNELIKAFDGIFGLHPGFRPAHAKGVLLTGTFMPTAEAKALAPAPHFVQQATPVTVRFSDSTGLPQIPDTDGNANPRGMAIRFNLGEHVHTDIVAHSTDGFPTRTGGEFLEFLKAVATSGPDTPSPKPIEVFLGGHPAALKFVQTPKPFPVSFGTEDYFGVTAMQFTSEAGEVKFGRYQIVPKAGVARLSDDEVKAKGPNYSFDEIKERVAAGPVAFEVKLQVAGPGDVVDDATIHWPVERPVISLGTVVLDAVVADDAAEQQKIIFDPIPRCAGIEPSDDPLLELRAAIYLLSGRRRRAATQAE